MKSAKKIIFNTGFLYVKLAITILLSLFSTRLTLGALGVEDFGIFNLIAGVIAMLSFLNGAMTVTSQRYISYYMGRGERDGMSRAFNTSIYLHRIIGIAVVLLLEVAGYFLLDGTLNINPERLSMAKWVYHFMVISTFFTINAVPYDAAINANEDMLFDAIVGIVEVFLKFLLAIYLIYSEFDKLFIFGLFTFLITLLVRVVKTIWCVRKYDYCSLRSKTGMDLKLVREMGAYAGWNLFGALCYVASSQSIAIVLNIFYGARLNASYAISNQVNGQLQSFSVMLVRAFNPQIVKSEGRGDRSRMVMLAIESSKLSTLLLLTLVVPILVEIDYLLGAWLRTVPEYTKLFCMLILVTSVVRQLSVGQKTAVQATGKIKLYQAIVGTLIILVFPISYLLLRWGMAPGSVLVAALVIEIIALYARLAIAKRVADIDPILFAKSVILKTIVIAAVIASATYFVHSLMSPGFLRCITVFAASFLTAATIIWNWGFNSNERNLLLKLKNELLAKIGWIKQPVLIK